MNIAIDRFKEEVEPIITQAMTKAHVPGMALAIVHQDEIIYQREWGFRNLQERKPFTVDTLNGWGSCSKAFTSLALIRLQERGELSIDDPLSKYLPFELGEAENPILIRHAMSHSSGMPGLSLGRIQLNVVDPDPDFPTVPVGSWQDLFSFVHGAQDWISHQPGEKFYYCNAMYSLLSYVIEEASGMPYEAFVRKHVLKPLGMERSGFSADQVDTDPNRSIPYTKKDSDDDHPVPVPGEFPFDRFIYPAGGLVSSCTEMTKFLIMMMNKGEGSDGQFISSESHETLTTGQVHTGLMYEDTTPGMYGMGWGVRSNFHGDTLISHGGGITGGYSIMAYLKEAKIGVVANCNYPGIPLFELVKSLVLLQGKDMDQEFGPSEEEQFLQSLCGDYQDYKGVVQAEVKNRLGVLLLEIDDNGQTIPLLPTDNKMVFSIGSSTPAQKLTFVKTEEYVEFSISRQKFRKSTAKNMS